MATNRKTAFGKFLSSKSSSARDKSVAGSDLSQAKESTLTQAQRNEKVSRALASASKSTGAFESAYGKRK